MVYTIRFDSNGDIIAGGHTVNLANLVIQEAGVLKDVDSNIIYDLNTMANGITKDMVGLGNADNTADINKNVLSATKLTTSRNINGVAFNGTTDINVSLGDSDLLLFENTLSVNNANNDT